MADFWRMMKYIYIMLLSAGAATASAQNDNSLGNLSLTSTSNANNAPASQAQLSPVSSQQVNFLQLQLDDNNGPGLEVKSNGYNLQQQALNNTDNNVNAPVQNTSANQGKGGNHKNGSFALPKPSMSSGISASRSSGKSHSQHFSKKIKKFNRRMSYVFSKKQKRSYAVDFCFAWSK